MKPTVINVKRDIKEVLKLCSLIYPCGWNTTENDNVVSPLTGSCLNDRFHKNAFGGLA